LTKNTCQYHPRMKKSIILTSLLFICMIGHLSADTVKEDKARVAAQNWYRHYAPENKKSASVARFSEYNFCKRTIFSSISFNQCKFSFYSDNETISPSLGPDLSQLAQGEKTNEAIGDGFDHFNRLFDSSPSDNTINDDSVVTNEDYYILQVNDDQVCEGGFVIFGLKQPD
jgi:hypothetical protein